MRELCRTSSASALVYDAVHRSAAHRPDDAQRDAEDDDGAHPETGEVHEKEHCAGCADRERHADALDDRLNGESLPDGHHLEGGVHRCPGRAVGEDDVRDAGRATSAKRPSVATPGPATTRAIATRSAATTAGLSTRPIRSPKRRMSGPATKARKTIAARLTSAVNAGEKACQVVSRVARLRTVEEQEVEHLGAHRGEHLVDEEQQDQAGREDGARRRPRSLRGGMPGRRTHLGKPPLGLEQEAEERELRNSRGEQQVLGRPEDGRATGCRAGRRRGSRPRSRSRSAGTAPSAGGRRAGGPPARR